MSLTTKKVEVSSLVLGRHLYGRMEMRNLGDRRLVDFFLWPKNMLTWMAQYITSTKGRARGRMPSGVVGGRRTMSMSTGVLWGLPHPHMVVLVEWAEELSMKRQIGPKMRDRLKKLTFYKKKQKAETFSLFRFTFWSFWCFLSS